MTTTVLVVEDEAKLRDLLRSYFRTRGHGGALHGLGQ